MKVAIRNGSYQFEIEDREKIVVIGTNGLQEAKRLYLEFISKSIDEEIERLASLE